MTPEEHEKYMATGMHECASDCPPDRPATEPRTDYERGNRSIGAIAAQIDRVLDRILPADADKEAELWPLLYEYGDARAEAAPRPEAFPEDGLPIDADTPEWAGGPPEADDSGAPRVEGLPTPSDLRGLAKGTGWAEGFRDRGDCCKACVCETPHGGAAPRAKGHYEQMRMDRRWPTPDHMRRTADALDELTRPARYGDVLRWVADLCDESLASRPSDE